MMELLQESKIEGNPRTNDDICDEVLECKPGYILGLGHGPKPRGKTVFMVENQRLQDALNQSYSRNAMLEKELQRMREILNAHAELLNRLMPIGSTGSSYSVSQSKNSGKNLFFGLYRFPHLKFMVLFLCCHSYLLKFRAASKYPNIQLATSLTASALRSTALTISLVTVPAASIIVSQWPASHIDCSNSKSGQSPLASVCYSHSTLIHRTSYNGYAGIYPQATTLQQVTLTLRYSLLLSLHL